MAHDNQKSEDRAGRNSGREDVGPAARLRAWAERRYSKHGEDLRGTVLHPQEKRLRIEALRDWRARKADARASRAALLVEPGAAPSPPPAVNWIPIGPTAIRKGQAAGGPPVSGRTSDIAIAPGGMRVYAATANGGVWRSDDGGSTWTSTMDALDLGPTSVDSDSLSCGAIAIDPANPDRVYVGTGEGESAYFFGWVLGVVYAYAGVGVVRSDSGGTGATPWITEPVAPGSPSLNGQAFFALAVDPTDSEHVVGATTAGIYTRVPDGMGGFQWQQTQAGYCTSVVVSESAGTVTWYAATKGGPVLSSANGSTWTSIGSGFPSGVTRISLAVQASNPGTIYAFSSAGVHRLDVSNGKWLVVTTSITVDSGEYGAAITVDPNNVGLIFIGAYSSGPSGDANLTRGTVTSSGSGSSLAYTFTPTDIGSGVHPDMHRVVLRSDLPTELWVTCDGGVFQTTSADSATSFVSRSVGLATALCTYLDQHPTEDAVVFCGVQDNGTLRYTGEEAWLHSADGDGGAVVVNWNNPYQILRTYVYGAIDLATDGGAGPASWNRVVSSSPGALFYPPLVGTPKSSTPTDANTVATGASGTYFSNSFGASGSWSTPDTTSPGIVSALAFVNVNKLYAGTTTGAVYSYTRSGSSWTAGSLVGQVGGSASSALAPEVTALVVDPADSSGNSFYVCLGGIGDWRRVWHYNGSGWTNSSGPSAGAATALIDVDFNALAVDPANPTHLYAGADIGVWQSTDSGSNWTPWAEGLPEAGVQDLRIHPVQRLIRAATYGRGMFQRDLDATSEPGVELYVRDTDIDMGRVPTVDFLDDPESSSTPRGLVYHWESPNIKVDPPSSAGTYQLTKRINFWQFVDHLVDGSDGVATIDSSLGTAINRVYVEVHNRGVTPATNVQVMVLLANASAGLLAAPLPSGYEANVQAGTPIGNANWQTVGIATIPTVTVGLPEVIEFNLPSTMLPPPTSLPAQSHYCLLAILNHPSDPFTNTETNADQLTISDRKVAQRNLQIVNFTGTLPPLNSPGTPLGMMSSLVDMFAGKGKWNVQFDTSAFQGAVTILLPKNVDVEGLGEAIRGGTLGKRGDQDHVIEKQTEIVVEALRGSRCNAVWARSALESLKDFEGVSPIRFEANSKASLPGITGLEFGKPIRAVLIFEAPSGARIGDAWELSLILRQPGGKIAGGNTYHCRVTLAPDNHKEVQIAATVTGSGEAREIAVHLESSGKAVRGAKGVASACLFTEGGMVQPPIQLSWDSKRKLYGGEISLSQTSGTVRRVTIVGRAGKLEGRKTIDIT